jgi:hypothetical protein
MEEMEKNSELAERKKEKDKWVNGILHKKILLKLMVIT